MVECCANILKYWVLDAKVKLHILFWKIVSLFLYATLVSLFAYILLRKEKPQIGLIGNMRKTNCTNNQNSKKEILTKRIYALFVSPTFMSRATFMLCAV